MRLNTYSFRRAIVRTPSLSVANGLSAAKGERPTYEGVIGEHTAYIKALEDAGLTVDCLPALDAYPDSVFVEDTALVFHGAAILLRPGAPSRRGEAAEMAPALARHFKRVLTLNAGSVDGGDILTTAHFVFIGRSDRTDEVGAQALSALVEELGKKPYIVETPPGVLHFKSDCSLLDEWTILSTERLSASGVFQSYRVITVPQGEEGAANAVRINDHVFISDAYPRTAELLARENFRIIPLPTREIAKIDAGLSCMSLRW